MTYQSLNPFDGRVSRTFTEICDDQLEAAVSGADRCFRAWRTTSFAERAAIVHRAAAILRARIDDFARPVTLEMGKLIVESRGEVALSADILDYYADHAEHFLAPQPLTPESGEATIESSAIVLYERHWTEMRDKVQHAEVEYGFGTSAGAPIRPLTRAEVKRAYPDNRRFHDLLDQTIRSDAELMLRD